ncbi:MFS transporter [Naasia sp. SYSU D00057]|uniref:MFS transporter n=1 Tax=Naasia sp. SYSU D00057 TaxID=2817380 RepID=UPI001B316141|nr:MFS transporter [Naasia sp. SYSU D00057]
MFFLPGIAGASWVTRTPTIRDVLGASPGQMGLLLFGLSVGAMAGVLASSPAVALFGGRTVVSLGASATVLGLLGVLLGAVAAAPIAVFGGLALLGAGGGFAEVGLNVEGSAIEAALGGRPLLPLSHGGYSLGTFMGAVAGTSLNAFSVPIGAHLGAVALLVITCLVWAALNIPPGTGRADVCSPRRRLLVVAPKRGPFGVRVGTRDSRLLALGGIVLAMALAEGAANDWLPLILVDGFGTSAAEGAFVYALFALSMTVGRLCGGPLITRFGRVAIVRASIIAAATGIGVVAVLPSPALAAVAAVLWGLGSSLGFPLSVSAAADGPEEGAAARVGKVATAGYMAFLVGPPLLGFLGGHVTLRLALLVVLAVVVAAWFGSSAAREQTKTAHGAPEEG